jgi:heptosyltransferase I
VADALASDFGFRVVLVGGRGERETAAAEEILRLARVTPLSAMGDPIRRMLWMLEGSALVLGPDTGPLHLARALGTPVVGLYGRTSPWRVGPYRGYQDLWVDAYSDPGEAPDPSSYTPRSGRMERITVEQVLARVQRAREHYGAGRDAHSGHTRGIS